MKNPEKAPEYIFYVVILLSVCIVIVALFQEITKLRTVSHSHKLEAAAIPPTPVAQPAVAEPPKVKPLPVKEQVFLRKLYAETTEQSMLHGGYDVEIRDIEGRLPALEIKYVLMTRALATQIMDKADTPKLIELGFKRMVFADGYGKRWQWTIK